MSTEKRPTPALGFDIQTAIPVLRMLDEEVAKAFYLDYLGFETDWACRFAPDAPVYMQIRLGTALLHLDGHANNDAPITQVNIQAAGLENYCQHLISKRASYPTPCLEDVRYVGRKTDMNIEDPFGNLLVFCCQQTET